ncbi:MAG: hypothetical protein L6R38_004119, partial [Xanthoria sp. 2 TBL-2021]
MLLYSTLAFVLALHLFTQALPAKGDAQDAQLPAQLNQDVARDDAGDHDIYLALLADYPHNGQFDRHACPSFETCSEDGNDYLSAL